MRRSTNLPETVIDYIVNNKSVESTVAALELLGNGELNSAMSAAKIDLSLRPPNERSFLMSRLARIWFPRCAHERIRGKAKGRPRSHFSLTCYMPWMVERFSLSDEDRFTMLSGFVHDPIQVSCYRSEYLLYHP